MSETWAFLETPEAINALRVKISESLRVTSEVPQYFVWPYDGAKQEILSKRSQLIFGRRGSGKTSLLRKLEEEVIRAGGFCAFVDVEELKSLTLPDQIITALLKLLEQLLDARRNLVGVLPADLREAITAEIEDLSALKEKPDRLHIELRETSQLASNSDASVGGGLTLPFFQARGGVGTQHSQIGVTTQVQVMESDKLDHIRRKLSHHTSIIQRIRHVFNDVLFVIFDDLYHISLNTQPFFLDHFHVLFKQNRIYMKIGSVKTRTLWHWRLRNQTFGLEVPNDADEINLDRPLEHFVLTRKFLRSILDSLARECGLDTSRVITDVGFNRLVQGSGGVARDCLSLLRATLQTAQLRIANEQSTAHEMKGSLRVTADDIWLAATEQDQEKRHQLQQDAEQLDQQYYLLKLADLVKFCYRNDINCFLVDRSASGSLPLDLAALWDAKFIHIVDERLRFETRDFTVYCLDLGVHAHERNKRNIVVDLADSGRGSLFQRRQLIYAGD
jgi:hypothetical protein